jgi:hypothetical protein
MSFGLCNAPASFERCMMVIFFDLIEKVREVFMDDFSVYGKTFDDFLVNLDKVLKRCQMVSHPVLRPNRMLIVCVLRNHVYTYTI